MPGNDSTSTVDVSTVLADPNFHSLPLDQKHKVLLSVDPNYAGLPPQEQQKALEKIGYPNPVSVPSGSSSNSIIGGAGRWIKGQAKGLFDTFTAPPEGTDEKIAGPFLPEYRMAKGIAIGVPKTEIAAGKQAFGQAKSAIDAAKEGNYGAATTQGARSFVTGASMFDPFATPAVVSANKFQDEGRQREAIGSGVMDVLSIVAGSQTGKPVSATSKLAKLTSAIGETGETASNLEKILPDISNAAATSGRPTTIGGLLDNLTNVKSGLNTTFEQGLAPIKNQMPFPTQIKNALLAKITPNMYHTAVGRSEIKALQDAAADFNHPWSYGELNLERMTRDGSIRSFYSKASGAQNAALKSNIDLVIDKTIRDEAANMVYSAIDKANPGMNTKLLKQKQSALWNLEDQLDKRIGKLQDKQLAEEGKTLGEKLRGSVTAPIGAGSVRSRVSGLQDLVPLSGPMDYANTKVRGAFAMPSSAAVTTRAGLMSLPLTHLVNLSELAARKSK